MQTKIKKMYLSAKQACLSVRQAKITLLIFFLLTTFGLSASIFAENNSLSNDNIFLDSDQDGLSDTEEISYGTDPKKQDTDGDGYSDGAEIKGGYDPLKPAPGDKIVENSAEKSFNKNPEGLDIDTDLSSDRNLTEDLSAKIAVMISNDDSEEITIGDINSMIDENIPSNTNTGELPEIDKSEINIKDQSYSKLTEEQREQKIEEDNDDYLSTVLYITSSNLPHNISLENEATSFLNEITSKISTLYSSPEEMEYFNDLADKGETILDQLKDTEVPESMVDTHIEGLQLAKYSISLKDKVKIDKNDPVSSIVSLSSVESLLVMSSDFIEKLEKQSEDGIILKDNSDDFSENNIEEQDDDNHDILENEFDDLVNNEN